MNSLGFDISEAALALVKLYLYGITYGLSVQLIRFLAANYLERKE